MNRANLLGITLAAALSLPGKAEPPGLAPAAIFSDHMVLQRETEVPVWGVAGAGETVSVSFNGRSKTTKADAAGKWMLKLERMPAIAAPQEMMVKDSKHTVTFRDVVVGEVWLGAGQSNMSFGWTFSDEFKSARAAKEGEPGKAKDPGYMGNQVDAATMNVLRRAVGNPMIRFSSKTRDHLCTPNGGWATVDEDNLKTLPALAGCIAVYLHGEIQVPVGIIVRAVSSTATVRWVMKDDFLNHPLVKAQIDQYQTARGRTMLEGVAAREGFGNHYRDYIAPVAPYALRGFLWDQGENGIGYRGVNWTAAMHATVSSWRKAWGQGDLPWSATDHYDNELEASMEQGGIRNFKIAKTDGLSRALHPLNKWQYAQRHLDNILPMAYGRPAPQWPKP